MKKRFIFYTEFHIWDYEKHIYWHFDMDSHVEVERKKFRDQFLYAEQELAAAKRREESLQEQLLKEVDSSEDRLRKQLQLYNELEVQ